MQILDSVSCADTFPQQVGSGASIAYVYRSNGGYFAVTANDVMLQLAYGPRGDERWTLPMHIAPGNGILIPGTTGLAFRNYTPGAIAIVSAGLAEASEPSVSLTAAGVSQPAQLVSTKRVLANRLTTFQAIPNAALTAMIFNDADSFDTDNLHDPLGANPSRIIATALAQGSFSVWANVVFAANAAGLRGAGFRQNGITTFGFSTILSVGAGQSTDVAVAADVTLNAGDYVEVVVYQTSGAPLNAGSNDGVTGTNTQFGAYMYGAV